jgi:hypothetical protein
LKDLFERFIEALLLCLSMGEKSGGAIAVNLLAAELTYFEVLRRAEKNSNFRIADKKISENV